jgi:hypothetical protein
MTVIKIDQLVPVVLLYVYILFFPCFVLIKSLNIDLHWKFLQNLENLRA